MKNILKNKAFAAAVCAVLIFMGIFAGVRRPFGNMKDEALVYFHGNDEVIGIKDDLDVKVETAYSLMSIANKYDGIEDDLITDLEKACIDVRESDSPEEAFEANADMDRLYGKLKESLDGIRLSEKDKNYNYSLLAQYNSADMIILNSEYNVCAKKVNDALSKFPANILSKVAFVGKMEYYGEVK
ncbi:MAG: hypothetical protein IKM61_10435 [Eubacteriaceae bacterium]|nr:hypothetical protein [Eubacteriaceae bacterium]